MEKIIAELKKRGFQNLVAKIVRAAKDYSKIDNVVRLLGDLLLDHPLNNKETYGIFIDDDSIDRGGKFIIEVLDEDGKTHGKLSVVLNERNEGIYNFDKIKTAEKFEDKNIKNKLATFLDKNDLDIDIESGDAAKILEKASKKYVDILLKRVLG